MFSLEGVEGLRFLTRSRLYSDEERVQLSDRPAERAGNGPQQVEPAQRPRATVRRLARATLPRKAERAGHPALSGFPIVSSPTPTGLQTPDRG